MYRFGSWSYSSDIVDIVESEPGNFVNLENYEDTCSAVVTSHESTHNVMYYECCPEPYGSITVTFQLASR